MKKFLLILFLFFVGTSHGSAFNYFHRYQDPGFNSFGSTGIIQMPSARFHNAGSVAISYQDFQPYTRLAMVGYPFKRMEAIYHYTDISDRLYSSVKEFSGNQTYKDKGFDIKIMLFEESKYAPQIALGLRDIAGTGFFSSEYLVASKRINNFDFSLGIGWGQLTKNSLSNPLADLDSRFKSRSIESDPFGGKITSTNLFRGEDSGIFFGFEYYPHFFKNLRLLFELDATDYNKEGLSFQKQDSKYNFGASYSLNEQLKLYVSQVRGNTLKLGFSLKLNLANKNNVTKKIDRPAVLKNQEAIKIVTEDEKYLYRATLLYLQENKIFPQKVDIDKNKISLTFNQNTYINHPMAIGRTVDILNQISPSKIDTFEVIPENAGFNFTGISIARPTYEVNKGSRDFNTLENEISYILKTKNEIEDFAFKPEGRYPVHYYSLGPSIQSHIGGPDRFFVGGMHLRFDSNLIISRKVTLQSIIRRGLVTSFDILKQPSDSIIPKVRTDIIEYLKQGSDESIARMQLNINHQFSKNIYSKLSLGIFEEMFAGFGGELLYRKFESNWGVGAELYRVRQREFDQKFDFRQYETTTGHVTFYIKEPRSGILAKIIGGRYLAEDSGITIDLSRTFKSGFTMGGFFSLTDISSAEFGEGSFDKGFYINIPLQSFFSNHRHGFTAFGLRPLTRDGAARVIVGGDLWGLTGAGSKYNYSNNFEEFYD